MEEALQSSQSFVRTLKSSTDPPHQDGPTKIQIARAGWESNSLYVPRKAGLILEWIFTRFHKEKARGSHDPPLLDFAHWSLVADILAHISNTQHIPAIARTSFPALVTSLIALYPSIPINGRPSLLVPILFSFDILWPLAVERAGVDPLSECLWSSLSVVDQLSNDPHKDQLVTLISSLLTSFRSAFEKANAAGKKKAYLAITQHHFLPWLHALHFVPPTHPLHEPLYSVGMDILFNADSLRTLLENQHNSKTNSGVFLSIFGPSTTSDTETMRLLVTLVPRFYRSYILALRKHRSSIFSGTSSGQEVRERLHLVSLRVGDECLHILKNMTVVDMHESIWSATVDILRIMEEETLYQSTEGSEHMARIRQVGEDALKELDRAWDDSQTSLVTQALEALCCIHRIEPDLEAQLLPQILERLATCSPALSRPALAFLDQLISYHEKTRTLHIFISHSLSALASSFAWLPSSNPSAIYNLCLNSPLLSLAFADRLSKALCMFVTSGQANDMAKSVTKALEASLPILGNFEAPPEKRRKVGSGVVEVLPAGVGDEMALNIVTFALTSRFGATALQAVLYNGVSNDAAGRRRTYLASMDTLVSDAVESLFQPKDDGSKMLGKRSRSDGTGDLQWTCQCLCSALLRLWYELFAHSSTLRTNVENERNLRATSILGRFTDVFRSCMGENLLPELQLEIARVLYALRMCTTLQPRYSDIKEWLALDTILDYIETNLSVGDADATRSKSSHEFLPHLTRRGSALALWSLTLEQHLPSIDAYASRSQLNRLVKLMVSVQSNTFGIREENVSSEYILRRAFTSASFWEHNNIRTSLLQVLEKQTSAFESVDTLKWLSAVVSEDHNVLYMLSQSINITLNDLKTGMEVYRFLRYFPPEYISRNSRVDLAKRALNADILVRVLIPDRERDLQGQFEWGVVFRSFVVMVARQMQIKPVLEMASDSWMLYLTLSKYGPVQANETYSQVTLELLSLIHVSVIRAAIKTEGILLFNILNHFLQYNPFAITCVRSDPLARKSFLCFAKMLVHEFNVSSFGESLLAFLRQLCARLEEALTPAIIAVTRQTDIATLLTAESTIHAWQVLLSLKHWLSLEPPTEVYAQLLITNIIRIISLSSPGTPLVSKEFLVSVLSLLVEQGLAISGSDCRHIASLVAAYVFFTASTPQADFACDIPMTRAVKAFSVMQYEVALELIVEDLGSRSDSQPHLVSLIHLSTLLLREAPERTSKISYEHTSQCIRIFLNRPAFAACPPGLAEQVLDFVQCQCTERAASLKVIDVTHILSIVSKLLERCSQHDEHTSPPIFQAITSVMNTLVRLRRDLLGPLLPQLSMILRRLLTVIGGIRPRLGSKQHRIISDSFPRWINPVHPLGKAEAQSLARLFTAIATKSLVRNHTSTDSQKAASLARPFARHAPYILLAYLQLMDDPLSVLSVAVRRELEAGLFALCSMMGEHGRDTLMAQSLDIGGKTLLKSLWKEYDKQRYVGRG